MDLGTHLIPRADGGGGCFFNDVGGECRMYLASCAYEAPERYSLFRPLERTDFHC